MTAEMIQYLKDCRKRTSSDLVNDIMPFWMKYGLDKVNGGIYTCIDRDGSLMDTTKSVWFQGRFAYIAAYAYMFAPEHKEWLEASRSTIDFIEKHCFDTDGHLFFSVTAEGKGVQKRRYVFSECFATIAMAQYAKASGDMTYADKAMALFKNMLRMLETPGFLAPKFNFEARGHSITMMLINVANVLTQVCSDPILNAQIDKSVSELQKYFMHPEFNAVLEMVDPEGGLIDTCAGRVINPGHMIETAWFILDVARARGDQSMVDMGTTIVDWSWFWGWDEPYGGFINFRDCKNFSPQDYSQDMKFWWPQCETIIATLYAYIATKDEKYLDMHKKAFDWAFEKFPDSEYGEWYGYLHRDGTVAQPAKGNLFKGPFHIPRMLLKATELYDEILKEA